MKKYYWLLELKDKATNKIIFRSRTFHYDPEDEIFAAMANGYGLLGTYEKIEREGERMITKRKLNKKLELLIHRQNLLATVVFKTQLDHESQQKLQKQWNDLWESIMEEKKGE